MTLLLCPLHAPPEHPAEFPVLPAALFSLPGLFQCDCKSLFLWKSQKASQDKTRGAQWRAGDGNRCPVQLQLSGRGGEGEPQVQPRAGLSGVRGVRVQPRLRGAALRVPRELPGHQLLPGPGRAQRLQRPGRVPVRAVPVPPVPLRKGVRAPLRVHRLLLRPAPRPAVRRYEPSALGRGLRSQPCGLTPAASWELVFASCTRL